MTDFNHETLASIGPKEFAQLVKATPDSTIAGVMAGDSRGKILDEIFARFPALFRADRAGSTNAVIHWVITERPDGGADTYEVVVENGTCTASGTAERDPKLTLTMAPVDFLKVVSGAGNPMMMFMTGKLKAKGDMALAANLAKLFNLPS